MPERRALRADPIAEAQRNWVRHGWGQAADGMAAVTAITRVQQILAARIDGVLRPMGLTFARYELLVLLSFTRRGSLPMVKASERLQVHPTSITNAVDRLERAGLVRRSAHPSDRRTTLVEITDAGRDLARRATEALNATVFETTGFSSTQIAQLRDILADFRRQSGDFA